MDNIETIPCVFLAQEVGSDFCKELDPDHYLQNPDPQPRATASEPSLKADNVWSGYAEQIYQMKPIKYILTREAKAIWNG